MLVARALKNSQLTCGERHAYFGDRTLGLLSAPALNRCWRNRPFRSSIQPGFEIPDMVLDQTITRIRFFFSLIEFLLSDHVQRIQIINEDTIEMMNRWLNVARDRKINDEERTIPTCTQNRFKLLLCHDRVRRGSGSNQDIKIVKLVFPVVEPQSTATHDLSESYCTVMRTIGYKDLPGSARMKASGCFLARIACSQDHDLAAGQFAKDLVGEVNGDGTHRYASACDSRCRSNMLSHVKRSLEKSVQDFSGGSKLCRCLVGAFDLAEDLSFTDHH